MAQSDTSLVIRDRSFFNATPWHRATLLSQSPAWQAFPCGLGANNEERGSKTARKMAQVTERGRGLPMAQSDTTLSVRERSFFKRHPVAQRDTALSERDRCYFFPYATAWYSDAKTTKTLSRLFSLVTTI